MNAETIKAGLQLMAAALAYFRQVSNDPAALKAIVDQARAEGREVDANDVKAQVDRMNQEGDALADLIASKQS